LSNNNNILIVGGTGFIGFHLAKKCLAKGWNVTSISSRKPKKIRYLPKTRYIICDISKKRLLKSKIKNSFKYVVNLGGYVDHTSKKKTFQSHYIGCKNLAEIFLKAPPKAFVQMGSSIEYGRLKSPQIESFKCNLKSVKSVYGKAKLKSSIYLTNLFKRNKFPSTILRLYLAYGPRQDINRFLPIIIKACIKNEKFPCSKGIQLRDFVYVDDVVNAILKSLVSKKAKGQIINLGSGKPKKIKSIIQTIKKTLNGGYPQFGEIKLRKDEIIKLYPNIKKAKKIINWKPKISFEKGLKETIKYYNEHKQ
jgi:nucleoside-diphosphate-sugar epimerase|tara:strand:+ start:356 stop:1276 length:921 start_codon:yes stop_codon:yes gene_type:complete